MITKVIPIGNSKGVRIPNHILKQMEIENQIELTIDEKENKIILQPVRKPREDWDRAFKMMHQKGDDSLIIDDSIDLDILE
jgi:antitoxin MazE